MLRNNNFTEQELAEIRRQMNKLISQLNLINTELQKLHEILEQNTENANES
jgi:uncharacterized protein (DUF885 family)